MNALGADAGQGRGFRPVVAAGAGPVLEIRGLSVDYGDGEGAVHAVDRVDLVIGPGEVVGIAGESGSGKSTLAHALTRLLRPPAAITAGEISYRSRGASRAETGEPIDVLDLAGEELRVFRWQQIAIVFQNAMSALNPVIDVRAQLADTLRAHRPGMSRKAAESRSGELLDLVGVSRDRLRSFPHQLSGGMRQRVMIAMALALDAELLIMDEPTTALDVVTQSEILESLTELRKRFGFAMVFITHDLSLLLEIADRIAIMYAGRLVEVAPARDVYKHPQHPYTEGLLRSFPPLSGPRRELIGIQGSPPDLRHIPPGCPFAPRCPHRMEVCDTTEPRLQQAPGRPDGVHLVSCWLRATPTLQGEAGDGPDAA